MNNKISLNEAESIIELGISDVRIAVRYVLFALLAIAVNIMIQMPFFILFDSQSTVYLALFFGTGGGLFTKYELDKRWIFYYRIRNSRDEVRKFGLYSLMGIFTTAIFWGFEIFFYRSFHFWGSQYVGGISGLVIGYVIKYYLDKKFVFKE